MRGLSKVQLSHRHKHRDEGTIWHNFDIDEDIDNMLVMASLFCNKQSIGEYMP